MLLTLACDRISARREPGAGRAIQGQAIAAYGRTAPEVGHSREGLGPEVVGGDRHDRDARYDSGVASEAHRTEVDVPAQGSREATDGEGSRAIGAFDGGGERRLDTPAWSSVS